MINKKIKYIKKRIGNKISVSKLETFNLIITYRCNSRCTYCSIWKMDQNNKLNKELTTEEIKTIFSDPIISKCEYVSITGGEPFLREDITEIIRFFVSKGKPVSVNTNGLLTDLIVKKLRKLIDIKDKIHIGISIDGKEETHNKLRGVNDAYNKSLKTIEKIKELGFKESISFTIGPNNFKDLLFVYNLSKKYKIDFAMRPVQICKYYNNVNESFSFKKDEIAEIKKSIDKVLRDKILNEKRNKLTKILDTNIVFWDNIVNYIEGRPLKIKCFALKKFLFIDSYGNILPCPNIITKYNIRNSNFCKLWKSKDFKKLQKEISELKACDYCWNDCAIESNLMESPLKTIKHSIKTINKISKGEKNS